MRVIECIVEVIMLPLMIYCILVLRNWDKAAKKIQALADALVMLWKEAKNRMPVVRCKDCKYSDVAYCRDGKTVSKTDVWCVYNEDRHQNNYYCADGKRKDGDE